MDIITLLREHGVSHFIGPGHRHVRAGFVGVDCYQCSPHSGKFKLGISLNSLRATCWSCSKLNMVEVLSRLLHVSTQEAYALFQQLRGSRPSYAYRPTIQRNSEVVMPYGVGAMEEPHKRYLRGRGFVPETLEDVWGLQGIPTAPRLSWRILIPIYYEKELVSWTTRTISDDVDCRYISAKPNEEIINHKHLLFGEDFVRHSIIVCEGPFDAMRVGKGAVAVFGLNVTAEQERRIAQYPVRVFVFDREPTAQLAARKFADRLSAWPGDTSVVCLTSGPDPASASDEDIASLRKTFLE